MTTFHEHRLPNGLHILGEISPSARSVALGFFVRTGARDETPEISGVTHYLEHMIFKGTPHRTALEVNNDFDRIGAQYNAFTSEENTVFYAAILPEYLPRAVDILADILRPSLRTDDFDMEKNVILEEISMYEDQPVSMAYDYARAAHFGSHPLANSVLGTLASVGALTRDQMHTYFQRRYVPANISVVIAGNFDWPSFVALIEKHCGAWEAVEPGKRKLVREAPGSCSFGLRPRAKDNQEHVILVATAPPMKSPRYHAADLLSMVLGDDSGSRLYWALVDPGYADSADASLHGYDGAGAYYLSLSGSPERTQKNLGLVHGVLRQLQQDGISAEELTLARNKALSRIVRSAERPMGRMMAIGMTWTYLEKYRTVDDELRSYNGVTLKQLRQTLDRYPIDQVTTLALGPLKKLRPPTLQR